MRKLLFTLFVLSVSLTPAAQIQLPRPGQLPRVAPPQRDVLDARSFGAVGDARVATDCSMARNSAVLKCASPHFTASDAGKVIAVYDARARNKGYFQPLSTTIKSVQSPSEVTLTNAAEVPVDDSERVVWGTDSTAAFQAAIDAAGKGALKTVYASGGHYLSRSIQIDCADLGAFPGYGSRPCTVTHHGLTLRGDGAKTVIENWDSEAKDSLIAIGAAGEVPGLGGPDTPSRRVADIAISDLTFYQVKNPTNPIQIISGYATENVQIHDVILFGRSYEGIVMGGGIKSVQWKVWNNQAFGVGKGGPFHAAELAAYNLNGSFVEAWNNRAIDCGQCFESSARHARFFDNYCENGRFAFYIAGGPAGSWDVIVYNNTIKNYTTAGLIGGGTGVTTGIQFLNNMIIDTPDIVWKFGMNRNSVNEGAALVAPHGISVISGNQFTYTNSGKVSGTFRVSQSAMPDSNADVIIITQNTITYPDTMTEPPSQPLLAVSELGGQFWKPGKAFSENAAAVSTVWGDYWYKALNAGTTGMVEPVWPTKLGKTVVDGTITWVNEGFRPYVRFADNRVIFPARPTSAWDNCFRFDRLAPTQTVQIEDFQINAEWRIQRVN